MGLKGADFNSRVDANRLRERLDAAGSPVELRGVLRERLDQGRSQALDRLLAGESGHVVAQSLCALADAVVVALYEHVAAQVFADQAHPAGVAVLAQGGYGRGELAPFSDLDLLFLWPQQPSVEAQALTGAMLYVLWDLGFKIGHASRDIEGTLALARGDYSVRTALLESRLLAGDAALAETMAERLRREVVAKDQAGFIAAKLAERDQRHARIGASRYMVEPNVKEGKGGLRDLHSLFWLAKHRYGLANKDDYVRLGVFTEDECRRFTRASAFLWTVRCHLHFVARRAEERLTFDLQPELAARLGYKSRIGETAVERFMRHYFLVATEVGVLTRTLCAKLEADHFKQAPRGLSRWTPSVLRRPSKIEKGFEIEGGRLNIADEAVFDIPANLIRLFVVAGRRNIDIHPHALRAAARAARRQPQSWRSDPEARHWFFEVMSSKGGPGAALRRMAEAGVLGRFIPEFGAVIARTQFNMYHHYTVDEHTLQAIDAIADIEQGRLAERHPLSTAIFPKIVNKRALWLAMLFHDVGKGGGDQQVEGAKLASAACIRLGLPAEEVELVSWLVRHHLVMSDVAQRRDLADPRTISHFAEVVGTLERLRLLLVLTVADIRAVGPGVWNDWKGQLLRDLYRLTEATLRGGRSDEEGVRDYLATLANEARERLVSELGDKAEPWVQSLDDAYWLSHDAEAHAWHGREILTARERAQPIHIATRVRERQGVTDVLIYAPDRTGLFASLAAAISSSAADIAAARVHTTSDGAALDVFSLQTIGHLPFGSDRPEILRRLTKRLTAAAQVDQPAPPAKAPSRRAAAFAIQPWVRIDNSVTPSATVIEVSGRDRLGLLAELARACADSDASIQSAHVDTLGERAADVFYVQDAGHGGQITKPARIAALTASLEAVLRIAEQAPPASSAPAKRLAVARASTAR
jgi:[protein-PII] uridylyltransferase